MVSIRLQRTGRRRQAQFRMVVQDSRWAPTSGKVIANLGFYNPHTKEHGLDLEKAVFYLSRGAQPSSRVIKILLAEKVDLPDWVKLPDQLSAKVKHPDKLRRNRPPEAAEAKTEVASDVKETEEPEAADETQATEEESATEPEAKPEAETAEEEPETESKEETAPQTDAEAESEAKTETPDDQDADSGESDNGEEAAVSETKEA